MSDDDWSSLDDDLSFITSSDDDGSSSSSSDDSYSSESSVESKKITPKRKATPVSTLTTRANTPIISSTRAVTTSKKNERKSILDSLVNKRRRMSGPVQIDSSNSELSDSSEDDFIVSDNEEVDDTTSDSDDESYDSSSSEDREGPGFYSRISEMMNRKDRTERSIRDSLTMRSAFEYMVTYYAICLSQRDYAFPEDTIDRKYRKQLPVMRAAVEKVERELQSRRELSRSNTWKPDSEWLVHVETHGYFRFIRMSNFYVARDHEERCVACNKKGWTTLLESKGSRYDPKSLWGGNLKKWMREMGWSRAHNKSSESELEPATEGSYILGTTCVNNLYVYLTLHHSKFRILCWIYSWMRTRGLIHASVSEIVERIEAEKTITIEEWYGKLEAMLSCIESTFDAYSDPLGGYEGTFNEVKRISLEPKKRKSSNRF